LNHFTVPVAIDETPPSPLQERAKEAHRARPGTRSLVGREPITNTVLFFFDPRSGRSRRVEGFLAQVLQRRRNHDTFRLYRIDVGTRDDLERKFLVDGVPSLVVVEDKQVRPRLEQPRGCKDLAGFLDPWLS